MYLSPLIFYKSFFPLQIDNLPSSYNQLSNSFLQLLNYTDRKKKTFTTSSEQNTIISPYHQHYYPQQIFQQSFQHDFSHYINYLWIYCSFSKRMSFKDFYFWLYFLELCLSQSFLNNWSFEKTKIVSNSNCFDYGGDAENSFKIINKKNLFL